ncbi:hypothetical protein KIN20_027912 [Parelaphostrongylus tenuis]|uniref:Uncharacterized protein n=1 Tax=Parelaphostrongylus tenuis TaxID=148309 RepID=A0AAD5R0C1_PARTN|nr:hypothetical protein KIN20_027912 [Parelaphostrongylus tenuis]
MAKISQRCIIVDGTVTGVCTATMNQDKKCDETGMVQITGVSNYTSITGTFSTTNIIMTNWSRMMWQSVVKQSGSNAGIRSI